MNPNYNQFNPNIRNPRPTNPSQQELMNDFIINNPSFYHPQFGQSGFQASGSGFQASGSGFQAGSPGFQVGSPGFHAWSAQQNMWGSQAGFQGGSPGFQAGSQAFQAGSPQVFARQMPHVEDDEDVQVVQETQEDELPRSGDAAPTKRRHRKKGVEQSTGKTKNVLWTSSESVALARAWINASEDPINSNYQRGEAFTATFMNNFYTLVNKPKGYRTEDSIVGKWRHMKTECQKFQQIWVRKSNANNHQSGSNDKDLLEEALQEYTWLTLKRTPFSYLQEWNVLRHCSKFLQIADDSAPTRQPRSKRTKTTSTSADPASQSSDARINPDLNASEDEQEEEAEPTYSRPQGRDKAKRAAKGTSSRTGGSSTQGAYSDALGQLSANVEGMTMEIKQNAEWEVKRVKALRKYNKLQERKQDIEIMTADYSHLPPEQREVMQALQQQIIQKYKPSN